VFVLSNNEKGAIAEAEIAAAAIRLSLPVLRPISEHGRYDLTFEIAGRLCASSANGAPTIRLAGWLGSV
jgi:hypothetical protein